MNLNDPILVAPYWSKRPADRPAVHARCGQCRDHVAVAAEFWGQIACWLLCSRCFVEMTKKNVGLPIFYRFVTEAHVQCVLQELTRVYLEAELRTREMKAARN